MTLISPGYAKLNGQLHDSARGFGQSGRKHAREVMAVCAWAGFRSVLDYGCGRGTFKSVMQDQGEVTDVREYDPAIASKMAMPEPADLVICTDVLEHVEPECLDDVLAHIWQLSGHAAFFVISNVPSHKHLPNGRNAHLIVETPEWWCSKVVSHNFVIRSRFVRTDVDGVRCETSLWLEPGP